MKVVILQCAELDLKDLRVYIIKEFSLSTWQKTLLQIKASIGHLAQFPLLGPIPDELRNLNLTQYRQVLSGMNRIIYEVRQNTVYIHVIVDVRRDMPSFLMRRLVR
ncbi:MAG: plasmid stabilization protein [Comamonadaceae bacterium CG12_big_fil_rev_8_21_14_0_65_59_15]|nr:MAG: plasmid stabilization protein [Comamonadaceae bacterium CG12_big_fil_rev_8_21_14_0_65_59_15]